MTRPYEGMKALDYSGERFALGRAADGYAIWDSERFGPPHRTFPLTDEGWAAAWAAYRELEGSVAGPSSAAIHPLGLAGVFEGGFRIYRRVFPAFAAVMAVVMIPVSLVQYAAIRATLPADLEVLFAGSATPQQAVEIARSFEERAGLLIGLGIGLGIVGLFVQAFLSAALLRGALLAYTGERPSFGELLRRGAAMMPSVAWVLFLEVLLVIVLFFLPAVGLGVLVAAVDSAAPALLFIPVVLLAILLFIRLLFAPIAVILERIRGTKAIGRSWRLTAGRTWPILGIFLLVALLGLAAGLAAALPLEVIAQAQDGFHATWVLSMIGQLFAAIVVTPFTMVATALLYLDSRSRQEALTLPTLRAELSSGPRD